MHIYICMYVYQGVRIFSLLENSVYLLNKLSHLELLQQKLKEQKEQLIMEFNNERASHQKMVGEYARLEQRFVNLQEELKIVRSTPEKRRRRSTVNSRK